jgi:glutaredoxin 3
LYPVTIYTTAWCPYCDAAKQLLGRRSITYAEVDIESWADPWFQLYETTGGSSVPQIVVGDVSIGGYDDLRALDRSGKLETLTSGLS